MCTYLVDQNRQNSLLALHVRLSCELIVFLLWYH
jgi:hypothetical protein